MTSESHLFKQLTRANGEYVTEQNLQQFIKKDVLPRIRVDQTPTIGLDGIKRQQGLR
jgi:hypothetical protein